MTEQATINNRYILHDKIGEGGMGIVYRATDRLTSELIALKQVSIPTTELDFMSREDSSTEHSLRVAIAQEFQILSGLRHPHIISVLDYGFAADQKPFFTMTYLPHTQTVLEAGQNLDTADKIKLIRQILLALSYLHRRGIIHRDIKPSNVLVSEQTIQVLDFGLSQSTDQDYITSGGTLLYMAPELLNSQAATEASDLYALGIMAYELFAGYHPFDVTSSKFRSQVQNQPPDLEKLNLDQGLAYVIGQLLSKQPQDRFGSAEACLNAIDLALNETAPSESFAIRESYLQAAKFVGREAELDQLKAALEASKTGASTVWLLGGESGVGKSRILNEFWALALVDGWQVLRGQSTAEERAPYQLWRNIIPYLVLNTEPTDLEAAVLYQISPNIKQLFDRPVSAPPHLTGQAAQQRINNTLIHLLEQQNQPTLLLLEDLHWENQGLSPLMQLLNMATDLPGIMVVGTYRNDEQPNLPKHLAGSQTILLNRLDNEEVAALSRAILGKKASTPDLITLLTQETEGNTFFLIEVIRALAEGAGQLAKIGQTDLPKNILTLGMQELLERRFSKMLDQDQRLLQLAAVAGRQLDIPVLENLSTTVNVSDWLRRAADAAIFMMFDGRWMFAHDKLRDTLLTKLSNTKRQTLHCEVAESIRTTYPDNPDYDQILLEHWHRADKLAEEVVYLVSVADRLISTTAEYPSALNLIRRSLERLPLADVRRIELLNFQATAHHALGDYSQTRTAAQKALKLAKQHQDKVGAAISLYNLAEVSYFRGNNYTVAKQYYNQSLQIRKLLQDRAGIADCLIGLGKVANRQGEFTQAYDYYQQGLAISQAIGDKAAIAHSLNYLGIVLDDLGKYEQAGECHQESLEIRQAIGDRRGIVVSLHNLGWISDRLKKYKEARDYFHHSLSISRSIKEQRMIFHNLTMLCFNYLQNQNLKVATFMREALGIAKSCQSTPMMLELAVCTAWIYLLQGNISFAAQVVGLVQAQPACDSQIQILLDKVVPGLEDSLTPVDLNSLYVEGQSLNVEAVIKAYLASISPI